MDKKHTDQYYEVDPVTVEAEEVLRVISYRGDKGREDRLSLLAYLLSRLQKVRGVGPQVIEAVLACFTVGVPSIAPRLAQTKSLIVRTVELTSAQWGLAIEGQPSGNGEFDEMIKTFPPTLESVTITNDSGLFAALASILIAIGKQGGSGPEAASMRSRPRALIDRFQIPESAQGLLPGREYGPSTENLSSIYNSFSTYTEPRMTVVKHFLGVLVGGGHQTKNMEILMTNFRLMKGAGMTHVEAIMRLMTMHPWTVRVPELAPFYAKFARELKEFDKVGVMQRHYHRLLTPQSEYMFLTSEYKPLIAVAGEYIKEVETSFASYVYNASEYATLISTIKRYEPSTSAYVGVGTLAQALGIQDMTLPTYNPPSSNPPAVMD